MQDRASRQLRLRRNADIGICGPPVGRELALMEALNHAENMIEAESLRRGYSFTRFLISTLRRL
ncbi:MAG TPA: hypothetical protein VN612_15285, partial [Acidobacteriaceae bacterium]|nr:hypothetical protein [Acidobacteriaceae bacterium]